MAGSNGTGIDGEPTQEQWIRLRPWAIELLSWAIAFMFLFSCYATYISISDWIKALRASPIG